MGYTVIPYDRITLLILHEKFVQLPAPFLEPLLMGRGLIRRVGRSP